MKARSVNKQYQRRTEEKKLFFIFEEKFAPLSVGIFTNRNLISSLRPGLRLVDKNSSELEHGTYLMDVRVKMFVELQVFVCLYFQFLSLFPEMLRGCLNLISSPQISKQHLNM